MSLQQLNYTQIRGGVANVKCFGAVVKGDKAQQQTYIDDCQAVKSKYPK